MNDSTPSPHPSKDSAAAAPAPEEEEEEEESSSSAITIISASVSVEASKGPAEKPEITAGEEEPQPMAVSEKEAAGVAGPPDDHVGVDNVSPATVFCIKLKDARSNLLHKMSVPELCRYFR